MGVCVRTATHYTCYTVHTCEPANCHFDARPESTRKSESQLLHAVQYERIFWTWLSFTNDGEGMDNGQQAAFRMQPKLHLDVEVD